MTRKPKPEWIVVVPWTHWLLGRIVVLTFIVALFISLAMFTYVWVYRVIAPPWLQRWMW